jgi:hypothetical protein
MRIQELCQQMMERDPEARGIVLAADLYAQLVSEEADDIPEEEQDGLRFYVVGYGAPILCDSGLEEGKAEYVTWPDTLAFEDYRPWDKQPWSR